MIRVLLQQFNFSMMRSQLLYFLEKLVFDLESYPGRFEWELVDKVFEKLVVDALGSVHSGIMEPMYSLVLEFMVR